MLLALTLSGQALAGSTALLKDAFDEFNYAVNVEWDQKDSAFYDQQVEKLEAAIDQLQEEGLTNEELVEFGLAQIKNSQIKAEAKDVLSLITSEKLSDSDASDLIKSFQENSYARGASWSGNVAAVAGIATGVIIVVVVAYTIHKSKSNVKNNERPPHH